MAIKLGKAEAVVAAIVVITFAVGGYYYPQMPEKIASHWNAQGMVDGYTSKFWGMFLMPIISLALALLLILLPRIDPLKANIEKFKGYYTWFVAAIMLLLLYIFLLTIFWNRGYGFNMLQLMAPAFAVLIYLVGVLVQKAKRNYFIGIRTPWTLSSDRVWDKTHSIAGRLFKAAAVVALLGVLFPGYTIYFILGPIVLAALFSAVYSYIEYRKEENRVR